MICSDIWRPEVIFLRKLLYMYIISRAVGRADFETILKYHEWFLCQISRKNHAVTGICLYYYHR